MAIFINTPIWVWCILLVLIILGSKQFNDRTVQRLQVIIAPSISLLLFIRILVTQSDSMQAMLMCLVGLLIGIIIGFIAWYKQPLITFAISTDISSTNRSTSSWHQRGSFVPLLVYMYLFTLRYLVVFLGFIQEKGIFPKEVQQYFPDVVNGEITAVITETIFRINGLSSIGIGVLLSIVMTMWLFEKKRLKG